MREHRECRRRSAPRQGRMCPGAGRNRWKCRRGRRFRSSVASVGFNTRPTANSTTRRRTSRKKSATGKSSVCPEYGGFPSHNGMAAEGLKRRSSRRPHKVRPADSCIPKPMHLRANSFPHLGEHRTREARSGCGRSLAADKPDGRGKGGRRLRPRGFPFPSGLANCQPRQNQTVS